MNSAIAWGLLSALGYGTTDFVARFSGRMAGVWRTMLYGQCAALVAATAWLLTDPAALRSAVATAPAQAWLAAVASALALLGATAMLYRGLATGRLAVVAPVTAAYGAVTAALEAVAGGGLPASQAMGLALTVSGAMLTAIPPRAEERGEGPSGGAWAAAAAACYGIGFWVQGSAAAPALGTVLPLWIYYAMGPLVLATLGTITGQFLRPPSGRVLAVVVATGLLAAAGYAALMLGYRTGSVALVTVLSSLASAVTVLLARVFIGERVGRTQWLGILVLVAGLALIHAT